MVTMTSETMLVVSGRAAASGETAGEVHVITWSLTTLTSVAGTETVVPGTEIDDSTKSTSDAPEKWLPTILTGWAPVLSPAFGNTFVTYPAAGVMAALAISTGGGPLQSPAKASDPSDTLRWPDGSTETAVDLAPEAAAEKVTGGDVSSIGAVAPIGNGLGRLTDPLKDTA